MRKTKLYYLTITALFTALIAVGAFIRIPMPMLPFTMQTFFAMLACFLLPKKYSASSAALYLILGLIGLPIFTSGGGPGYVLTPGFGYLVGFIVANFAGGHVLEKKVPLECSGLPLFGDYIAAGVVNILVVYIFGLGYWYMLANMITGNGIGLWPLILNGFLMTLPGDLIKMIVATLVAVRVKKII